MPCCYPKCKSRRGKKEKDLRNNKCIRFFKFPTNDHPRCEKWISNIGRKDINIENMKSKVVCSLHFELTVANFNCLIDFSTTRLSYRAIPTIFDNAQSMSTRPIECVASSMPLRDSVLKCVECVKSHDSHPNSSLELMDSSSLPLAQESIFKCNEIKHDSDWIHVLQDACRIQRRVQENCCTECTENFQKQNKNRT